MAPAAAQQRHTLCITNAIILFHQPHYLYFYNKLRLAYLERWSEMHVFMLDRAPTCLVWIEGPLLPALASALAPAAACVAWLLPPPVPLKTAWRLAWSDPLWYSHNIEHSFRISNQALVVLTVAVQVMVIAAL